MIIGDPDRSTQGEGSQSLRSSETAELALINKQLGDGRNGIGAIQQSERKIKPLTVEKTLTDNNGISSIETILESTSNNKKTATSIQPPSSRLPTSIKSFDQNLQPCSINLSQQSQQPNQPSETINIPDVRKILTDGITSLKKTNKGVSQFNHPHSHSSLQILRQHIQTLSEQNQVFCQIFHLLWLKSFGDTLDITINFTPPDLLSQFDNEFSLSKPILTINDDQQSVISKMTILQQNLNTISHQNQSPIKQLQQSENQQKENGRVERIHDQSQYQTTQIENSNEYLPNFLITKPNQVSFPSVNFDKSIEEKLNLLVQLSQKQIKHQKAIFSNNKEGQVLTPVPIHNAHSTKTMSKSLKRKDTGIPTPIL